MGKRGPAKTPSKLTILRGNPGKRSINKKEPMPDVGKVECPEWLCEKAKAEWNRVVPQLLKIGLLAEIDIGALERYCEMHAQFVEASEFLHKHGTCYPIKDDDGNVKCIVQVPQVSIARNAAKMAALFASKFGLTPSDRVNLVVPEKLIDNPLEKMING